MNTNPPPVHNNPSVYFPWVYLVRCLPACYWLCSTSTTSPVCSPMVPLSPIHSCKCVNLNTRNNYLPANSLCTESLQTLDCGTWVSLTCSSYLLMLNKKTLFCECELTQVLPCTPLNSQAKSREYLPATGWSLPLHPSTNWVTIWVIYQSLSARFWYIWVLSHLVSIKSGK